MSIQVKSSAKCPTCGAALYVGAEDRSAQCKYCKTQVEISRFIQEENRLVQAIEEMKASLSQAERRVEEAVEEFIRTGTSTAGTMQRRAEEHYEALMDALKKKQFAYENAQARKLNGYFRLGEEAQRARRYEEAIEHYQRILAVCEEEAEVHWRVLMCRYGVEYVRDQLTGTYLPTLTKMQVDDILNDVDYIAACRFAQEESVREYYRREGERLAEILEKYQRIDGTTEPYDVFISVKQGDDEGEPTADSMVGLKLYYQLQMQGFRVFNSRESLEPGEEYEPYIMHALRTAKVLVVVASSEEYLNACWIRNEWRRFAWLRKNEGVDGARRLIVYVCGQRMLKIPAEIGAVQIIDCKNAAAPVEELSGKIREVCKGRRSIQEERQDEVKRRVMEAWEAAGRKQAELKRVKKEGKRSEKLQKKERKVDQKRTKEEELKALNEAKVIREREMTWWQKMPFHRKNWPVWLMWVCALLLFGGVSFLITLETEGTDRSEAFRMACVLTGMLSVVLVAGIGIFSAAQYHIKKDELSVLWGILWTLVFLMAMGEILWAQMLLICSTLAILIALMWRKTRRKCLVILGWICHAGIPLLCSVCGMLLRDEEDIIKIAILLISATLMMIFTTLYWLEHRTGEKVKRL